MNIAIIYCGGTIGMVQHADGVLRPLANPETLAKLIPELSSIADIDLQVSFNIDSSDVTTDHWLQLNRTIRQQRDNYDGFVILHGTDTLAYTASALSFLLADIDCPIVITGAQRPLRMLRSDARANIIDAVEVATHDIPEVTVLFNTKLWRGNRVQKISNDRYNAFHSPNYPPLADLGLRIDWYRQRFLPSKQRIDAKIFNKASFSKRVFCLKLYPGLSEQIFSLLTAGQFDAIVIQGLGSGNIPLNNPRLLTWLQEQVSVGTTVALTSQSPSGYVDLSLYEGSRKAMSLGLLPCQDMTIESSLIKLMLLHGQFNNDRQTIAELFVRNLVGELTVGQTG